MRAPSTHKRFPRYVIYRCFLPVCYFSILSFLLLLLLLLPIPSSFILAKNKSHPFLARSKSFPFWWSVVYQLDNLLGLYPRTHCLRKRHKDFSPVSFTAVCVNAVLPSPVLCLCDSAHTALSSLSFFWWYLFRTVCSVARLSSLLR